MNKINFYNILNFLGLILIGLIATLIQLSIIEVNIYIAMLLILPGVIIFLLGFYLRSKNL